MNKIETITPIPISRPTALSTPEPACRLVVLIPAMDWDYNPAMRRVWELAAARGAAVLLLSLYTNAHQELSLRRSQITIRAMLQDSGIPVEAGLEYGVNWVELVKRNHRAGDTIVCFAGERSGPMHQPLSQVLRSSLKFPVYILPGPPFVERISDWRSGLLEWMGYLVILIGFSLLQINILQLPKGVFQNVLFILSLLPEYWLIWFWRNWFV